MTKREARVEALKIVIALIQSEYAKRQHSDPDVLAALVTILNGLERQKADAEGLLPKKAG